MTDYLIAPEPRTARGRRDDRRPVAGARRRRHRQDPGADHAIRPHPADRPRVSRPGAGGHLHQSRRAGDAGTCRRHARPSRRGPVARHLPRHLRPHAAPPRRPGRADRELQHHRHRRPASPAEAGDGGRPDRHQALDTPGADGADPTLEGPRPDARSRHRRRGQRFRQRPRPPAVCRLPGAPARGERRRFWRPSPPHAGDPARPSRRARAVPSDVPLHPGRRIPGHQPGPVPVAAAAGAGAKEHLLRRRRRPIHLLVAWR